MIIRGLVENVAISDAYGAEHGLSLYIETKKHKILFDVGQKDLFAVNARTSGVDLTQVDTVIISHGHYDHGGGIETLLELNAKAKIYVHQKAFEKHFSRERDGSNEFIGLNTELMNHERIILTSGHVIIDEELELFSEISGNALQANYNRSLLMEDGNALVPDTFEHEQNLIITQGDTLVLLEGCAHRGIVNIIRQAAQIKGRPMDIVLGGFHLMDPDTKKPESPELIAAIAKELTSTGSKYYTCHCTGVDAFSMLRNIMHEKIEYFCSGSIVSL